MLGKADWQQARLLDSGDNNYYYFPKLVYNNQGWFSAVFLGMDSTTSYSLYHIKTDSSTGNWKEPQSLGKNTVQVFGKADLIALPSGNELIAYQAHDRAKVVIITHFLKSGSDSIQTDTIFSEQGLLTSTPRAGPLSNYRSDNKADDNSLVVFTYSDGNRSKIVTAVHDRSMGWNFSNSLDSISGRDAYGTVLSSDKSGNLMIVYSASNGKTFQLYGSFFDTMNRQWGNVHSVYKFSQGMSIRPIPAFIYQNKGAIVFRQTNISGQNIFMVNFNSTKQGWNKPVHLEQKSNSRTF